MEAVNYDSLRFQSDLEFFRNAADAAADEADSELDDEFALPAQDNDDGDDDTEVQQQEPGVGILSLSIDSRHQAGVNPSDWSFQFTPAEKNVIAIEVQSVELPNSWHTISAVRGNNTMTLVQSDVSFVLVVPDGSYAIGDLLTALNGAGAVGVTFALVAGKVTVTQVGGTLQLVMGGGTFGARPAEWGLGWVLGFRVQSATGLLSYAATAVPSLRRDPFVFLQLGDWDGIMKTDLQTKVMAKLPTAHVPLWDTIFADGRDMVTKRVVFPTPRALRKLDIRVTDGWGQVLDLNDQHMSLTLALTIVGGGGL